MSRLGVRLRRAWTVALEQARAQNHTVTLPDFDELEQRKQRENYCTVCWMLMVEHAHVTGEFECFTRQINQRWPRPE